MTRLRARTALAALLLALASVAGVGRAQPGPFGPPDVGGGPPGPPPFLDALFRPGLVMRHQSEIGLTAEQQETIQRAMQETQAKLVTLEWQQQAASEKLAKLVEADKVDEAAALAQAASVMDVERQIKQANLALLIRIKNVLTPPQQERLRTLRKERPRERRPPED